MFCFCHYSYCIEQLEVVLSIFSKSFVPVLVSWLFCSHLVNWMSSYRSQSVLMFLYRYLLPTVPHITFDLRNYTASSTRFQFLCSPQPCLLKDPRSVIYDIVRCLGTVILFCRDIVITFGTDIVHCVVYLCCLFCYCCIATMIVKNIVLL